MALHFSVKSKSRILCLLVLVVLSFKEMSKELGQSKKDYLLSFVHTDRDAHILPHHTHDLNEILSVLFHLSYYFTSVFSPLEIQMA